MAKNKTHNTQSRLGVYLDDDLYPRHQIVVAGKYRGQRQPLVINKGRHMVRTVSVVSDNGWHRGRVKENNEPVFVTRPLRSRDEALRLAQEAARVRANI